MTSTQHIEPIRRRLRIVRAVALVDLVLLLALVSAALLRQHGFVQILGPLHGINFMLLLVIVGVGAVDGVWEWWFPVAVLLTAGPPGAFLGEWLIHRRLSTQVLISAALTDETVVIATKGGAGTSSLPVLSAGENEQDERKEQE